MIASDPGEVVLLPFPFTDFSTLKQRPCVVISSAAFNCSHPDVIVAAITSHVPEQAAVGEYRLKATELRACGLPKASMVRLGEVVRVYHRLIRKRLGILRGRRLRRVLAGVRAIFRTSRPARASSIAR